MKTTLTPADRTAIKSQARDWWVRLDNGNLSAQEKTALTEWLEANPAHQQAFDDIQRLWSKLDRLKDGIAIPEIDQPTPTRFSWRWLVPAMVVCCLALVLFNPISLLLKADFHTNYGERRTVQLSDGSTVYLNSNTALSVNLNTGQRHLTLLKGEAWFKVRPDSARPFRVKAGPGTVTALGTAFNIRLLDRDTEVSVTEHSVTVDLAPKAGAIVLTEGQQVAYNAENGLGQLTAADNHAITAWQRGKLVFQNRPLGEVIAELNRYHRGYWLIRDPDIAERRVNGVFRTDNPLEILNALQQSLQLNSTRISDYLILLHR
ncbi:MAG: FecR family protein [Methylovulum sp.]